MCIALKEILFCQSSFFAKNGFWVSKVLIHSVNTRCNAHKYLGQTLGGGVDLKLYICS